MTWLVWRQQRVQVLVSVLIMAPVIGWWWYVLAREDVADCVPRERQSCYFEVIAPMNDGYLYYVMAMTAIPVLLGVFAGGPLLAREFETGTYSFIATQQASRVRWWATKIVVSLLPLLVGMAVLGVLSAAGHESGSFRFPLLQSPGYFAHGPLLAGYTTLAFALSATFGILTRNTVTAIVAAIVSHVLVAVILSTVLQPLYSAPERLVEQAVLAPGAVEPDIPSAPEGAQLVGHGFLNAGKDVTERVRLCGRDCADDVTHVYVDYFWKSDFWVLQWSDSAVLLGVSILVLALGTWRLIAGRDRREG